MTRQDGEQRTYDQRSRQSVRRRAANQLLPNPGRFAIGPVRRSIVFQERIDASEGRCLGGQLFRGRRLPIEKTHA